MIEFNFLIAFPSFWENMISWMISKVSLSELEGKTKEETSREERKFEKSAEIISGLILVFSSGKLEKN